MSNNVGSMEVEYSVVVGEAIKNINRYNKMIEKNNAAQTKAVESEKKSNNSFKKFTKSWAILSATIIGGFYGIVKASSYASIYTDQFSATLQQLANTILEETGINKAIEDFLREFQRFVDKIENGDDAIKSLLESLDRLKKWFTEQSAFIQFLTILGIIIITVLPLIAAIGLVTTVGSALSAAWTALVAIGGFLVAKFILLSATISRFIAWMAAGSAGAIATAAAIGLIIGMIVVWLLKKAGILDWFSTLGEKFREWDSWIKDIILIITSPLSLLGAAIIDIVDGNLGFPKLKKGFEIIWDTVGNLIDRVKNLIDWIKKIPSKIGFSGGSGTSIKPSSMPGGGDSSSVNDAIISPSGRIITTNPADYLIATKTPGDLGGKGNTYNIAPVININSTGSNNDISRQVSKAISDEIKRITKI